MCTCWCKVGNNSTKPNLLASREGRSIDRSSNRQTVVVEQAIRIYRGQEGAMVGFQEEEQLGESLDVLTSAGVRTGVSKKRWNLNFLLAHGNSIVDGLFNFLGLVLWICGFVGFPSLVQSIWWVFFVWRWFCDAHLVWGLEGWCMLMK